MPDECMSCCRAPRTPVPEGPRVTLAPTVFCPSERAAACAARDRHGRHVGDGA